MLAVPQHTQHVVTLRCTQMCLSLPAIKMKIYVTDTVTDWLQRYATVLQSDNRMTSNRRRRHCFSTETMIRCSCCREVHLLETTLQIYSHILHQATGYASQNIWCVSQARINWEGCGRKVIRRRMRGMMEVGHWLVQMEWYPAGLSVCLPLFIFPCTIKSRRRFLLAPAYPGTPRKRATKRMSVCFIQEILKYQ